MRREETREKILRAAVRIFAELGFEAASMGSIAARADLKKALVQYHFETKLNLWQEAVNFLWSELHTLEDGLPRLSDFSSHDDEREILRQVLRAIIRFAKSHPDWVGIMFREASSPGPRLDWLVENHLKRDIEDGTAFIATAQSHGLLPEGPPLQILNIISGALTYPLLVAPLTKRATGINMASDESLDATVDILLNMLKP
nr:TetR/AcrR family transcriptional regulator [Litorivivens lipolytica]